jgi:hypothetical protein
MSPVAGTFLGFLILTVALLGGVVATGSKGRLLPHLVLVGATLACLATTIYWAERLGDEYDLASAGWVTNVHLFLAKLTTLAYLLPLATGLRTLRNRARRPAHRTAAYFTLGLTLVTFVTGAAMLLLAERLPES